MTFHVLPMLNCIVHETGFRSDVLKYDTYILRVLIEVIR